jgi:hypothetical protein
MRITERQIRKIVREMALKSYNIVTDDDPVGDEPFVIGNVIDKGLYDEEWPDQATSTLSYTRQLDPVEREKGRDYVAGTYGQKGYRRTVERQYARVPFPVNIFVLPPGARDKQYRSIVGLTGLRERGPDPRMMGGDMQGRLMELIRVLSPDEAAQISPEDMTLIIVPGNNKRYPGFWRTYDGAYMAIHALFEYDGPFSDELHGVKKIYKAFDMFNYEAGVVEDIDDYSSWTMEKIVPMFKMRTMSSEVKQGAERYDIGQEICTYAFLQAAPPIRLGSYPVVDREGNPLDPAITAQGNEILQRLYDHVNEMIPRVYSYVQGKILIVTP